MLFCLPGLKLNFRSPILVYIPSLLINSFPSLPKKEVTSISVMLEVPFPGRKQKFFKGIYATVYAFSPTIKIATFLNLHPLITLIDDKTVLWHVLTCYSTGICSQEIQYFGSTFPNCLHSWFETQVQSSDLACNPVGTSTS